MTSAEAWIASTFFLSGMWVGVGLTVWFMFTFVLGVSKDDDDSGTA